ncbi:unnamed protein product [Periconia digitata]|uniref:Uncharacterized protein n=1 Tax=Periconia digitata TaxID=1303443 RepID=A0A9W4URD5_9PLEO|nr:unnamed protein product [Periconia digitata]
MNWTAIAGDLNFENFYVGTIIRVDAFPSVDCRVSIDMPAIKQAEVSQTGRKNAVL